MRVAIPTRPRSLGDKLQQLARLSPDDVKAIEALVEYRLTYHLRDELRRIREAARPWPPPRF
jgi:hypothetical protein